MTSNIKTQPKMIDTQLCVYKDKYKKNVLYRCLARETYKTYKGKNYCLFHYPSDEKAEDFFQAIDQKMTMEDYDFRGYWFPKRISFAHVTFGKEADFRHTRFTQGVDFSYSTFNSHAHFYRAKFKKLATFQNAKFEGLANFSRANFTNTFANFWLARFQADALFEESSFCQGANFSKTLFKEAVRFGNNPEKGVQPKIAHLAFQLSRFDKPSSVIFRNMYLKPYWFINADCRQLQFINVDWDFKTKGIHRQLEELIKIQSHIEDHVTPKPRPLLETTYRRLALNAEENHRYTEASKFRFNSFRIRRPERFNGLEPWKKPLEWLYWVVSGYGESIGRASVMFIAVIAIFTGIYTKVDFEQKPENPSVMTAQSSTYTDTEHHPSLVAVTAKDINNTNTVQRPLSLANALRYSIATAFFKQPTTTPPATSEAKSAVLLESLLGPTQGALLALAVRRKFMR